MTIILDNDYSIKPLAAAILLQALREAVIEGSEEARAWCKVDGLTYLSIFGVDIEPAQMEKALDLLTTRTSIQKYKYVIQQRKSPGKKHTPKYMTRDAIRQPKPHEITAPNDTQNDFKAPEMGEGIPEHP